MNRTLIGLTERQLLGQKRTILMLLSAMVPVLIAVLYRAAANDDPQRWAASVLNAQLIVGTFLPLAALVFGTAALGSEFEDGTAVYILSKPIPRRVIVLSKLLIAWLATAGTVLAASVVATVIVLWGEPRGGIVAGFALAGGAGAGGRAPQGRRPAGPAPSRTISIASTRCSNPGWRRRVCNACTRRAAAVTGWTRSRSTSCRCGRRR